MTSSVFYSALRPDYVSPVACYIFYYSEKCSGFLTFLDQPFHAQRIWSAIKRQIFLQLHRKQKMVFADLPYFTKLQTIYLKIHFSGVKNEAVCDLDSHQGFRINLYHLKSFFLHSKCVRLGWLAEIKIGTSEFLDILILIRPKRYIF